MKREDIIIETDENLITFIKEKINDFNIDIYDYINNIVYSVLEEENLTADKV